MKHIREWNELLTLPVALLMWFILPNIIHRFYPESGSYDVGVLNGFILATIGLYFGKTVVWIALKIGAPGVYRTLDNFLITNTERLTSWQKGIFSLCYFSLLFLCWVIILLAVM